MSTKNSWNNTHQVDLKDYICGFFFDSPDLKNIIIRTDNGIEYAYISASENGVYKIDINDHM